MESNQRIDDLEGEIKILKNEVQSVLLDVREHVLSFYKNPFQMVNVQQPKSGADDGAGVTTNVGGGDSGSDSSSQLVGEKLAEQENVGSGQGAKMEDSKETTSQLKALMDQLERERQSLKQDDEESLPPLAIPGQAPMASQASQPGQPAQASPMQRELSAGEPLASAFQPMQQAMQPSQASPGAPGLQPGEPMSPSQTVPGIQPMMQGGFSPSENMGSYAIPGPSGGAGIRPKKSPEEQEDGVEEERVPRIGRKSAEGHRYGTRDTQRDEGSGLSGKAGQVNLLTLVGLVRWVERSITKIGKEKVEAIVEIYRTAGYLPASYKDIIPQIIRLADGEKPEEPATMGDSILVLLKLDSLLGGNFKTESSILSTLFNDDGGFPWIKQ